MKEQKGIAAFFLLFNLLLWSFVLWLLVWVPKMAASLSSASPGRPLPFFLRLVIGLSHICQSAGIFLLLPMLVLTVGCAIWILGSD